jgi:hypothetical protein
MLNGFWASAPLAQQESYTTSDETQLQHDCVLDHLQDMEGAIANLNIVVSGMHFWVCPLSLLRAATTQAKVVRLGHAHWITQ